MTEPTPPAPRSLPGRVRLVVLFGGRSAEHEISCVTASHLLRAADATRYDLHAVGITPDGRWVHDRDAVTALLSSPDVVRPLAATGRDTTPEQALAPIASAAPSTTDADAPVVVLPLLHGTFGEDGTVQGLLELAGVPYVGSGVLSSAVCMDKAMAKTIATTAGLPQCTWLGFDAGIDRAQIVAQVVATIGFPCFVKPANLGSSVGISKAHDEAELGAALDVAFTFDEFVVVEEFVAGREIEVAVLGASVDGEPRASVPGEIIPGNDFYDFDDKYRDGAAQLYIPATLDEAAVAHVQGLARKAFRAYRCDGMARVDFFLTADGSWLLNEVNTIPGFTPLSMYPKLFEASGLPYAALIDELVLLALQRHARRSALRTTR